MFSGLTQGSLVYILDKTKGLQYKVGEVVGITQPKFGNNTFNPSQPNTVSVQYPQVSVIPNYNGYNGMSCGCNNGQGFWY